MRTLMGSPRARVGLLGLACLLAAGPAEAALITNTYTLPEFNALVNAGQIREYAVAESRIGDAGSATHEVDLGRDTAVPAATAAFAWASGSPVDFTLRYDAATALLRYTVGSTVDLSYLVPAADRGFRDLFVRTFANAPDASTASILVDRLVLNGTTVGTDASASAPPSGGEVLHLGGPALADGFVLTGRQTFTWTGTRPRNSNLATQIKLGLVVPEPGSLAMLGLGAAGVGLAGYRRRGGRRRIGGGAASR
jgi:hypothetical protein